VFFPIATMDERIGILAVAPERDRRPLGEEDLRLLTTFANQAALAIERSLLTEERTRAEVLRRTDELKTALLSAVSHDLRTPLASIKASITTLMQPGIQWSETDRRDLEEAIDEEADRLNRLVANLLDLSRIEAGALKPTLDWYQASEIVYDVIDRCAGMLAHHRLSVDLPAHVVWVNIDFVMISEVLTNLIENATKYSSPGSRIRLLAREQGDMLVIQVEDEGMGVPEGEEERIFDKFYRVEARYRPVGSGIGLAICRGFVEAHGGRIWVDSNPTGGSTFAFTVPLAGADRKLDPAPDYVTAHS
jgi:two-component system sensor histidine kinase KdpD